MIAGFAHTTSTLNVAAITQAVADYQRAYDIAKNPKTHTRDAVQVKDQTRNAMVKFLRGYARRIRANDGISDADKIALGLPPHKLDKTRRQCPQTSPRLGLMGVTPGMHTLSIEDSIEDAQRKKPFGATRWELFMTLIGPDEIVPQSPTLPDERGIATIGDTAQPVRWAWYVGSFTRFRAAVRHPQPPQPMRAVYWARWANNRGEFGPWSHALPTMFVGKCMGASSTSPKAKNNDQQGETELKLAA